jgi:heme/copper-type cytochrome/quinol oxidase subunit 3
MSTVKPAATTRSSTGIDTGKLSIWWLLASEIVIFGGILASYIMHRLGHAEFGDYASHTNVWAGGFNTFVLLTSSLFAVLAHQAAEKGDGKKAHKLLWLTIAGGGIFLVVKSFEWTYEISNGYTLQSNAFWHFYYTAAGLHGLHVIGGMIAMGIVAQRAKQNLNLNRVELVGIYWHFVDVVWIFLFPLLYIAK